MHIGLKIQYELLDYLKEIARPRKVKVSRKCLGMYKKEKSVFWRAEIREDYSYLGEGNCYVLKVSIKPLVYDDLRFAITEPGENIKYTDVLRANRGFAFYEFFNKPYIIEDNEAEKSERLNEIAKQIFEDTMVAVSDFLKMIDAKHGDFHHYIISLRNDEPMLAGLSCMALQEYSAAINCFSQAECTGRYWNLAYGALSRLFHNVCIDYCTIMLIGSQWKKEYVFSGIES